MSNEVYELLFDVKDIKVAPAKVIKPEVSDFEMLKSYFKSRNWECRDAGNVGMIESIVYEGDQFYLPREMDETIIPQEGLQRLNTLDELGINVKGVVIGHDIPKEKEHWWNEERTDQAIMVAGAVGAAFVAIVGALIGVCVYVIFSALCAGDPMLIVVLEDDTWVEIYWWFE